MKRALALLIALLLAVPTLAIAEELEDAIQAPEDGLELVCEGVEPPVGEAEGLLSDGTDVAPEVVFDAPEVVFEESEDAAPDGGAFGAPEDGTQAADAGEERVLSAPDDGEDALPAPEGESMEDAGGEPEIAAPEFSEDGQTVTGLLYRDADGAFQTCESATVVTTETVEWKSGWYAVTEDVTVEQRVKVWNDSYGGADVRLILCNGARLVAKEGITVNGNASLTVYAQSVEDDMGELFAGTTNGADVTCEKYVAGIGGANHVKDGMIGGPGGTITINGGRITAISDDSGAAGIGGGDGGDGGTITINGGVVTATSGFFGAGIGGGSGGDGGTITINGGTVVGVGFAGAGIGGGVEGDGGAITINGGTVEGVGGDGNAGIGGGSGGDGGTITINGGHVTARSGNMLVGGVGAGIGGGQGSPGGEITVNGGTIEARSGSGAGIGGGQGSSGGAITVNGGTIEVRSDSGAGIGGGQYGNGGAIVLRGGKVNAASENGAGIGAGHGGSGGALTLSWSKRTMKEMEVCADRYACSVTLEKGFRYADGDEVRLAAQTLADNGGISGRTLRPWDSENEPPEYPEGAETVSDLLYRDADGTFQTCKKATVVTAETVEWTSGWYAVTEDVTIEQRVKIQVESKKSSDVRLILCNGARLVAKEGISVNGMNANISLTIYAQSVGDDMGELFAGTTNGADVTCKEYAAGIGGAEDPKTGKAGGPGGTITINGGRITAVGGEKGAGIGGGEDGAGGTITINGGVVTAAAGDEDWGGAGIGGGSGGDGGTITINGGTVEAVGAAISAGIGGGNGGDGGTITINGGTIEGVGGDDAAGIGGGYKGDGGTITINGGHVTARSGITDLGFGAGIGGGYNGAGGTITINGGTIEARSNSGAGIGGGLGGAGGEIAIYDGKIDAVSYSDTGIGGGSGGPGGAIAIYGGSVNVCDNQGYGNIGAGHDGSGGTLTLSWYRWNMKQMEVRAVSYICAVTLEKAFKGEKDGDKVCLTPQTLADNSAINGKTLRPARPYAVTVAEDIQNGTVTAEPMLAEAGDAVRLTATPAEGYRLSGLTVTANGDEVAVNDDGTFAMPAANVAVTASFEAVQSARPTVRRRPADPDTTLLCAMTPVGSTKMRLSWTAVSGAEGYDVFFGPCDGKDAIPPAKTVSDCGCVIRKLKRGTAYKACVKAWRQEDGRKVYIGEASPTVHCIAGGYNKKRCNAKQVTVRSNDLTLAVGGGGKVRAFVTGVKAGRQVLSHAKGLRYYSSNRSVATVDDKGAVTAVGAGACEIIAMADNGVRASAQVIVVSQPQGAAFASKRYSVKRGKKLKLAKELVLTPAGVSSECSWSSSDPEVAAVNARGVVKGLKKGTAKITVRTANGLKASVKVKVE